MKKIILIAAIQKKDNGIGFKNDLLFHIKEDMKRFRQATTGNAIIMGRKTFESIGVKPLPNRTNIVLSRNSDLLFEGVTIAGSIEDALDEAEKAPGDVIYIIGGSALYEAGLPIADELMLTVVDGNKQADTFFPDWSTFGTITSEEKHVDDSGLEYSFVTVQKK